ncbi:hypothetical protein RIF29_47822 [Crotalaria pallida]|uniref:Uncharacterized protein n=1 Tax=Crotalaria pallida TaxID=3830 RepID=A0AAN9DS97_CROPI
MRDKLRYKLSNISRSFDGHKEIVLVATAKPIEQGLALQLVHKQAMLIEQEKFSDDMDPQEMDENLQLLRGRTLSRLMISPRVLERRESGKNPSYSVTEQSDDSSVTQDDPLLASFAVYPLHPSEVEERKGTLYI